MKSIYSGQHKRLVSKLITARKDAGLLQREAARLIHATQSYLSKIEAGQVRLDIIQLKKFAQIYNKPLDYFLDPPAAAIPDAENGGYLLSMGYSAMPVSANMPGAKDTIIWEMDKKNIITYISPSVKKILGYETEEMIGETYYRFIPDSDLQAQRKFHGEVIRNCQAYYRFRHVLRSKSNGLVPVETNAIPFFSQNGKLAGYRGIDRLVESKDNRYDSLYAAMVECSPFGIAILRNWEIDFVNLEFQRMLAYEPTELRGMKCCDIIAPKFRELVRTRHAARLAGESVPSTYEMDFIAKTGNSISCEIAVMPLRHVGTGEYMVIARDITQAQNERRRLEQQREQAERYNRIKTRYIAQMSHEIRTPLNALRGFADLLSGTSLSNTQREYVEIIRESAEALGFLAGDVIDISKIELGKLELENIDFDIRRIAQEALQTVAVSAAQKKLELASILPPKEGACFRGDPLRVRQIIINLLSNAVKFTGHGSVNLSIKAGRTASGEPVPVDITVADTGPGIAKEHQRAIFEEFTQEDNSTARLFGGSGLGLAIVRTLAEKMGGKASLASEPGKGSIFSVRVFLTPAAKPCPVLARETNASGLRFDGRRVLVAEDNAVNLKLITILLKNLGFTVETAENGEQAIKKAAKTRYDLVILDMVMPQTNGMDAARAMRGKLKLKTPILALTAAALKEDRDEALACGINDYILKPVKQREIAEKIAELLNYYR